MLNLCLKVGLDIDLRVKGSSSNMVWSLEVSVDCAQGGTEKPWWVCPRWGGGRNKEQAWENICFFSNYSHLDLCVFVWMYVFSVWGLVITQSDLGRHVNVCPTCKHVENFLWHTCPSFTQTADFKWQIVYCIKYQKIKIVNLCTLFMNYKSAF